MTEKTTGKKPRKKKPKQVSRTPVPKAKIPEVKATTLKAVPPVPEHDAPEVEEAWAPRVVDGCMYLDREDLLEYNLAEANWLNAQLVKQAKKREKEDTVAKLSHEVAQLERVEIRSQRHLIQMRKNLGEKYGVNFLDPNFSWDDETGRLLNSGEPTTTAKKGTAPEGA